MAIFMKTAPLLSIGIPTKNRVSMLSELLDDIERYQAEIPIVISDNSEGEETANLIEKYGDRLNIKYLHPQNSMSQSENFNILLKAASTKYMVMMHDDDRLLPASLEIYSSLVNYLESYHLDVFGVYVHNYKFKNYERLHELQNICLSVPTVDEIKESLTIFDKGEYQSYFVEKGIGGKAPGVLVNRSLIETTNIYFPTDTGAKHDKAFFLMANAIGSVGCWQPKIIANRLHQQRSTHRNVTHNYQLFNQKILEIYQNDSSSIHKIHQKRFEKWMEAEPRFKPKECYQLLSSSQLSSLDIVISIIKYLYRHSVVRLLSGSIALFTHSKG